MKRKQQLEVLAARFGFCGCKDRCQWEHGENGNDSKPRGRSSVCELEAEQLGIEMPDKEDEE